MCRGVLGVVRITLYKAGRPDTDVEQLRHVSNTLAAHEPLKPTDAKRPLLDEVRARTARVNSQSVHHGVSHTTTRAAWGRTPGAHGTRPLHQA